MYINQMFNNNNNHYYDDGDVNNVMTMSTMTTTTIMMMTKMSCSLFFTPHVADYVKHTTFYVYPAVPEICIT